MIISNEYNNNKFNYILIIYFKNNIKILFKNDK